MENPMRKLSQGVLLIIASLGVITLGYYAFIMASDTMTLPFVGQSKQTGSHWMFPVALPNRLSDITDQGPILDGSTIQEVLTVNGKPLNEAQKDALVFEGKDDFFNLRPRGDIFKEEDVFRVSSREYNEKKKTGYKLPNDIEFVYRSEVPRGLVIQEVGDPKEKTFSVEIYGFHGLSAKDIRWYAFTSLDQNAPCGGEAPLWNARRMRPISTRVIQSTLHGPREKAIVSVDVDTTQPRQCVIAGLQGEVFFHLNRSLSPFSLSGEVLDMLSPEYDMKSRVGIQFSEAIFSDTGSLYSPEYRAFRTEQKKKILKHLHITPDIEIGIDDIALSPNKLEVFGNFREGVRYKIELDDIEDIFGRRASFTYDFLPEKKPFLSLVLDKRKKIFSLGEDITAKIYSLSSFKDTYTVKMCELSLEDYARVERIEEEKKKAHLDEFYELFASDRTKNCVKKDITLTSDQAVTSFRLQDMVEGGVISPGLYVVAFRNQDDIRPFDRFVSPRVFSVLDTHITMKLDVSGDMQVLVTDMLDRRPRPNAEVRYSRNIGKTADLSWDPEKREYQQKDTPLSDQIFATGILLGTTDDSGMLSLSREAVQEIFGDSQIFSMYNDTYEYGGDYNYPSFFLSARSGQSFGYIVSTWNDGITGWNFGFRESDYSWDQRPPYSAYIHTDRRLYLPGEKVHIHAIIRKNTRTLDIPPSQQVFVIRILDSQGMEVKQSYIKPNEFGTLVTEYDIPEDARLGNFSVQISPEDGASYIENGWTEFQVEVFQKPNFTAQVTLSSPDIKEHIVQGIRKQNNTDLRHPWYDSVYSAPLTLEGVIRGHYYNGASMKNIPFHYRVLRSPHYDEEYWEGCFWGCFYTPPSEFYTEGTGHIGSDGLGYIRIPVQFSSFSDDYMYTVEVTIRDPLTGEEVTTPATLLAKLPDTYKSFLSHIPLKPFLARRMLHPSERIDIRFQKPNGTWSQEVSGKYRYEVIRQQYTNRVVDDLRMKEVYIPQVEGVVVLSGMILDERLDISTDSLGSGEYAIRVLPITPPDTTPPEHTIETVSFLIAGQENHHVGEMQVIPEHTIYRMGDRARVFFVSPFPGGYLYITRERGGILESKYIEIQSSTHIEEYEIDGTFEPNVYIGAVAFPPKSFSGTKSYSVGYGEIITDLSEKRLNIHIATDKTTYKNRDNVTLTLGMTDIHGMTQKGELTVMVVDESLIRLLGNIDLDIIPKFYQKFPFTIRTVLTRIGMEQNRFLSRRGISGGSGDKGSPGSEIASRSLFKNTVYFNGSVLTDDHGRANVEFSLPDNVTDYRVIVIGQTKDSRFGSAEKVLQVRRDYTLETHIPAFAYPGDTFALDVSAYNATKKITHAQVQLVFGTEEQHLAETKEMILNVEGRSTVVFDLSVGKDWMGDIPYTVTLMQGDQVLDRVQKTMRVLPFPLIESSYRQAGVFTGSITLAGIPREHQHHQGNMQIRVANNFLSPVKTIIEALRAYPYGCAEQTLAGTLAHAYALRFSEQMPLSISSSGSIDVISKGVQKIARMQLYGGWKYWETDYTPDPRVSPYVLRSLLDLRDLGISLSGEMITAGVEYIENIVTQNDPMLMKDPNYHAELFVTLARAGSSLAQEVYERIDIKNLSRHGLLMYAYGIHAQGKQVEEDLLEMIASRMVSREDRSYYYWSLRADQALYAQLLVLLGKQRESATVLEDLLYTVDADSYFVSTQEYLQILRAVLLYTRSYPSKESMVRLDALGIKGEILLSGSRTEHAFSGNAQSLGQEFSLHTSSDTPIFYEVRASYHPEDITQIQPKDTEKLAISQEIEHIDESLGVSPSGEFLGATPVQSDTLKYGNLYRVKTTLQLTGMEDTTWRQLVLENFTAGGIRALNAKYQTESRLFASPNQVWDWTYTESKPDRIFAEIASGFGNHTVTYTYYFRAEFRGSYLLPPPTAYFMYQPEIHAIGSYRKLTVQ